MQKEIFLSFFLLCDRNKSISQQQSHYKGDLQTKIYLNSIKTLSVNFIYCERKSFQLNFVAERQGKNVFNRIVDGSFVVRIVQLGNNIERKQLYIEKILYYPNKCLCLR